MGDEDKDALGGACKTDGDHGLGFFHHSLGYCADLIMPSITGFIISVRLVEIGCTVRKKQEERQYPSLNVSLPKTLDQIRRSVKIF